MKKYKKYLAGFILHFLVFVLVGFQTATCQQARKAPLIAKDTTNTNEKNNTLLVFVGEKIELTTIPYKEGDFNSGVKAKYRILERVYGTHDNDVIEFEAYDHYGAFPFKDYKTVLLYLSMHEGKYYQEKYMFNPVFRTKSGRWAGPYADDDYDHSFNEKTSTKPEIIEFKEEASFPTKMKDKEGNTINLSFLEPYFKTVGDKAVVIYGNYVEELFKLKRDGFLKARKLF